MDGPRTRKQNDDFVIEGSFDLELLQKLQEQSAVHQSTRAAASPLLPPPTSLAAVVLDHSSRQMSFSREESNFTGHFPQDQQAQTPADKERKKKKKKQKDGKSKKEKKRIKEKGDVELNSFMQSHQGTNNDFAMMDQDELAFDDYMQSQSPWEAAFPSIDNQGYGENGPRRVSYPNASTSRFASARDASLRRFGAQSTPLEPMQMPAPPPQDSVQQAHDEFFASMQQQRESVGASSERIAEFHGDRLLSFLQQNGQDDKKAIATALAFEQFLKQQQDALSSTHTASRQSASTQEEPAARGVLGDEWIVPNYSSDSVSEMEDSFAMSIWDDGTPVHPPDPYVRNGVHRGNQRKAPPIPANESRERSFWDQMASLSDGQRACVTNLKIKWEKRDGKRAREPFPDEWYLRFARCSPDKPFNQSAAYAVMKKFKRHYMELSIVGMERQLLSKTLFPCPGLESIAGHDMFYMRPSRYVPKTMAVTSVIDNLVYVMEAMLEKEKNASRGIGFVANMTGWTMSNFNVTYCHKFMMSLQGRCVPARVELFLIVNPPSWFGSIWAIMKNMLSETFRRKVFMISFHAMKHHLAPGYEQFLPDECHSGTANADQIVQDFMKERKQIESMRILSC